MQVSDSFPFKWINKKWKEGFYVTSMATSHTRWAVVMSRNAGFIDQCVELDFQYTSEGIHRRWDAGSTFSQTCLTAVKKVCLMQLYCCYAIKVCLEEYLLQDASMLKLFVHQHEELQSPACMLA